MPSGVSLFLKHPLNQTPKCHKSCGRSLALPLSPCSCAALLHPSRLSPGARPERSILTITLSPKRHHQRSLHRMSPAHSPQKMSSRAHFPHNVIPSVARDPLCLSLLANSASLRSASFRRSTSRFTNTYWMRGGRHRLLQKNSPAPP